MGRMDGQVALVTGGASGIGRAICQRLAADGAAIAIADRNRAGAEETAALITQGGGQARAWQLDITDYACVCSTVDAIRTAMGPIDVLVNNAGWDRIEPFVENTPDFWNPVIDINLKGPIHCCRAVVTGMVERGRGKIVSIASDSARVGSSGEAIYSACKGAVISLSKTLARELARYRINVNVVSPGPTDTPLIRGMAADGASKLVDALVKNIPFRRMAQPEEIAAAVAFFASPDADFITGQVLSVNGGMTMVG